MTQTQQAETSPQTFKLSANENPFGPSPKAVQAVQAALPTLGLYPPRTDAQLKTELSSLHGLSAEHFVTGTAGATYCGWRRWRIWRRARAL